MKICKTTFYRIFTVTTLILILLQLFTIPAIAEETAPRIELSEYSWHFGTHPQHSTVYRDLVIYNNGTADLELYDVQPTCGCTVLDRDQYPMTIPPGGSHTVNVTFNTLTYLNEVMKYIVVRSNDTTNSSITVYFWIAVVPTTWITEAVTFTITITTTTETQNTTTTQNPTATTTSAQSPTASLAISAISFVAALVATRKSGK